MTGWLKLPSGTPQNASLRVWRVVRQESATYTMIVLAEDEAAARKLNDRDSAQVIATQADRRSEILSCKELA